MRFKSEVSLSANLFYIYRRFYKDFCKDQAGQATTEYILLLSISVALFAILKKMLQPAFQKLTASLQGRVNQLFNVKALHQFRVR